MYRILLAVLALSWATAQQIGTNTAEKHPSVNVATCTQSGGCSTKAQSIVLDANWRWIHKTSGYTNCYTGQTWNTSICSDSNACVQACALDGADYSGTYGISTTDSTVSLGFVTQGSGNPNVGSRVYLMQDDNNYQTFNLLNGEFTFDVDVSQLPCGLNGALYFSQMDQDGGMKRFPSNKAGATYGTGYCDAQCPRDLKFPQGEANVAGWTPSKNDPNSGTGNIGSCCSEMDIWEANSMASAYTAHPCIVDSSTACTDSACTGTCDAAGCDFNSWRMGNQSFYGPGLTIDTKSKITVVTQFITDDNTNQGNLVQINRFYVQNGKVVPNSYTSTTGINAVNSITDNYCAQQKQAFTEGNVFANLGGLKKMGAAFKTGMVLVMSIWDDHNANALWLDSNYPLNKDASQPGVSRGPCSTSSGVPADVEKSSPNAKVSFSNIKWGELNSTFAGGSSSGHGNSGNPSPPSTVTTASPSPTTVTTEHVLPASTSSGASASASASTSASASASASAGCPAKGNTLPGNTAPDQNNCVARWWQCGGQNYNGPKCCQAGLVCNKLNDWYSQCV